MRALYPSPRSKRQHRLLSASLILAALLLFALISMLHAPLQRFDYYGLALSRRAPDFTLRDTSGEQIRLSEFRGKFVYLMFGYLGCDLVCHTQSLTLQMLSQRLPSERVQFLYLGMDPQWDTPERIRHYFDVRARNFTGLIARDRREAQAIAGEYHAYFSAKPNADGQGQRIDHPGFIYLIDPDGEIRLLYSGSNLNLERMLDDLDALHSQASGA